MTPIEFGAGVAFVSAGLLTVHRTLAYERLGAVRYATSWLTWGSALVGAGCGLLFAAVR